MSKPNPPMIRITAPHFCAGYNMASKGRLNIAPIIRYMRGWSLERIQAYCDGKGWKVEVLPG